VGHLLTARVPHREVCPDPRAKVGRLLTARVPHREVCPDPRAKVGRLLTARVQHTRGDRKQTRATYPGRPTRLSRRRVAK